MKTIARLFAIVMLGACALLSLSASAAEQPYDKATFDKLLAAGKPVIVHVYADWCPTCKAQKPSIDALAAEPKFKSVTILLANYDKQEALKKSLDVRQQSTFVVFKGGKEVARSTGEVDRAKIEAVFAKAL